MTNFEKIKKMSVDELVDFIAEPCSNSCVYHSNCNVGEDCEDGVKKWLESEAEE